MLVRLAFFATPWICHCTRFDFVIPEVEIKLMATGLAVFLRFCETTRDAYDMQLVGKVSFSWTLLRRNGKHSIF